MGLTIIQCYWLKWSRDRLRDMVGDPIDNLLAIRVTDILIIWAETIRPDIAAGTKIRIRVKYGVMVADNMFTADVLSCFRNHRMPRKFDDNDDITQSPTIFTLESLLNLSGSEISLAIDVLREFGLANG